MTQQTCQLQNTLSQVKDNKRYYSIKDFLEMAQAFSRANQVLHDHIETIWVKPLEGMVKQATQLQNENRHRSKRRLERNGHQLSSTFTR
jgi:hypothetical protein